MSHAAYTDLKAAWHTDKISTLRQGEQIVPPHVQLIISDLCNHDCHFCSYRMSGGLSSEQFGENGNMNPNRKIPTAKAKEILDDCAELGVKAIQFTGGGEPTVHPDHIEIFRHAQILGLETALVTNGFLLRDGWEEVLPKMKWIRVSVDASSPEVYGAVRRINPNGYWKVLSHVGDIVKATKGMDCLVGVGYVITKENWQDLALGLRRIRDTGVPYVRLSAMFSDGGSSYYDGVYENICKVIAPLKKDLEDGDFQIVDVTAVNIAGIGVFILSACHPESVAAHVIIGADPEMALHAAFGHAGGMPGVGVVVVTGVLVSVLANQHVGLAIVMRPVVAAKRNTVVNVRLNVSAPVVALDAKIRHPPVVDGAVTQLDSSNGPEREVTILVRIVACEAADSIKGAAGDVLTGNLLDKPFGGVTVVTRSGPHILAGAVL